MKTRMTFSHSGHRGLIRLAVAMVAACSMFHDPVFAQKPPYPVILIHGLGSNHRIWEEEGGIVQQFQGFGWSDGGVIQVTLDYRRNRLSLLDSKEVDIHLFTSTLPTGDFYRVNFDVDATFTRIAEDKDNLASLSRPLSAGDLEMFVNTLGHFRAGDIIRIHDEFIGIENILADRLIVIRGLYGSQLTDHGLGAQIFVLSNQSNQASIAKQAYGLKLAIDAVKAATQASKVILVGHSMGGLAARRYIQDPQLFQNDVAKLVTLSTPHLGSDKSNLPFESLLGLDNRSDAIRDLRYKRDFHLLAIPPTEEYGDATFLFGGSEGMPFQDFKFYHYDFDADGQESQTLMGLNYEPWLFNVPMTAIIGTGGGDDDGVVQVERQYFWRSVAGTPRVFGDTVKTDRTHITAPSLGWQGITTDYATLMRGLDEPNDPVAAYAINLNEAYHCFSFARNHALLTDTDWFTFELAQSGAISIFLSDLPTAGQNITTIVSLFLGSNLQDTILVGRNTGGRDRIYLTSPMLAAGSYALRIVSAPNENGWKQPMTLRVAYRERQQPSYHLKITDTKTDALHPRIAVEANGASHVVWQDFRDGNWEIYFALLDASGNFLRRDVRVTNNSTASTKPDVSIDDTGRSYIVWLEGGTVKFCVLDREGNKIVGDVQISGGDSDNPAISTIASGRSHVVWQRREITFYYVYFAQFDANGQRIGNEIRLSDWDLIGGIDKSPAIDNDAGGNSYLLWRDLNTATMPLITHALFYAKVNDNRSIATRARVLNQDKAEHPAIAASSPYLFLVCSDNRGSGYGIYSLTNVDNDYRIDEGGVNARHPSVGYDLTHNAYITWVDERDGNEEIYLAHLDPQNRRTGADLRVTDSPGRSTLPAVEMDGAGNYFMVWQDNSDGDWDLWITRGPAPYTAQLLPDLTVTAMAGPAQGNMNQPVMVQVTVNRSGGPLTLGSYVLVRVFASSDQIWDENDLWLGQSTEQQFLNADLNRDGTVTANLSCLLPELPGTYYYLAVVDPVHFHPELDDGNNVFAGNLFNVAQSPGQRFTLGFPLAQSDPYTAQINSVFDHSLSTPYRGDNVVIAHTGEKGERKFGSDEDGYAQESGESFIVNGSYRGANARSTILYYDGHPGIDYHGDTGREVYAAADGTVILIEGTPDQPTGNGTLEIDHGNGYHTLYLHLSKYARVKNDAVQRGDLIGYVGNTGKSTGPHLHFEVRRGGIPLDPYGWQGIGADVYGRQVNEFLWEVTSGQTEWTFDESFEKWRTRDALNKGVNRALGGKWVLDPGADPGIISPTLTAVAAEQYPEIELRMSANGGGTSMAKLYFKTTPDQSYTEERSIAFSPTVVADNTQRIFRAVTREHPLWRGQIVEIRIDPSERGDPASSNDLIYIDYVKCNTGVTAVEDLAAELPSRYDLMQNYPNPFNPETTITFALPVAAHTKVRIFDVLGREVQKLVDETMQPGYHKVIWDGKDTTGRPVPSGVYLYKMQAGEFVAVKKSVVIR